MVNSSSVDPVHAGAEGRLSAGVCLPCQNASPPACGPSLAPRWLVSLPPALGALAMGEEAPKQQGKGQSTTR